MWHKDSRALVKSREYCMRHEKKSQHAKRLRIAARCITRAGNDGITYCPPSLQSYIARLVIQAIKSTCKKQPEICGLRQQEKTYAPLKLMQAVTNEVNEICRRYLDNSRLALLPPPSSTPQVTVGATRNARRKMEDRHMILHDLNTMFNIQDDTIVDYYAVFDGHGGQDAAAYCATHLHQYLVESVHYPTDPERALRDAFLTTDAQFLAKSSTQKLNGGTTAICALLINKKLYIAWVGDSMASLVTYGNVKQLVNPHRPTREDESERIRNMGGVVVHCMGVLRVNGFLSISRAIGDVPYKPYISGEPEVRCVPLDGTEDFLIIACDGLWDYVDQRTAALRVYRQVQQNPYDLKHVHQALLQSAKRAGSLDNITVIVVFLTPPIEIASRSKPLHAHQAPNGLLLNNMDPNNPIPSNHDQFEVKPAYIKQLIDDDVERPEFDMDFLHNKNPFVCGRMASNGKRRDDNDDEYDYTDIGPETDVDAGEDVNNKYPTLAASSSLDPSPESEKSPEMQDIEKHNDDNRNDNDYSNRDNANVCPVDSTINDGDVDNRVRPSDRDVRAADDETLRDDDDARIETAATHTVVDDESPPSPRAAKPLQDVLIVAENVADSEDSEDEWNYYRVEPNQQESAAVAVTVEESHRNIEEQKEQDFESVVKDSPEVQSLESNSDIKCEILARDISTPELIDIDISEERKLSESKKNNQLLLDLQEDNKDLDMDFQLNPEAAEFVPLSPPLAKNYLRDFAISGSPLKQTQPMDDIPIPSQSEFDKEVCYRPKEIGEDFSDGHADLQNNSSQNMDVSDISSTKAEVGDDESMHVMSTSQWQADISSQWNEKTCDDAGSDLDENDIVTKDDPMAMSLTPGSLKAAFEKDVDLNAVHMLDDSSDGADQVSTPPRSPKPCNEDRPSTPPLSENMSAIGDFITAQHLTTDDSVLTTNSESIETTSSLSATMHNDEDSSIDRYQLQSVPNSILNNSAAKKLFDGSEEDIDYEKQLQSVEENERFVQEDSNIEKENENSNKNEENDDEKESMESEESKNLPDSTNYSNFNDTISVLEEQQSLLETEKQCRPETPSDAEHIDYGDSFNAKMIPDDVADSFKFTMESPQLMNLKTEDISQQSLLSQEIQPETTSVVEQTHFDAFEPEVIPDNIVDPLESTRLTDPPTDWTDFCKTGSMQSQNLTATFERNIEFEDGEEGKQQKEAEKYNKIEDDSNENDIKPDSTTELNLSDSQKSNFVENELQHKDQVFLEYMPETVKLIDNSFEQEEAEKKATDVTPINVEVFEEEVTSESTLPKQEEEPQKTAETNDTATIDKSKELSGVTEASVGAAIVATATAMAIKTKTTNAKRPTKTTTTKASTASTTKTAAKSITPTSPSKAISATMRSTTTTSPAQLTAKKSVTNTVTRKQLDGSTKAAVSSASSKTTKTTTTKVATTATRTSSSPRLSSTTRPKTTTNTTTSKVSNGTLIEKKSLMSADTKSINKPTQVKSASSTLRTTTTSTNAKTTQVKTSSTTTKTSVSNVTLKSRPASATLATKTTTTSKQSTTVTNSSRPKTAPTSGGISKPREGTGKITAITGKSPLIDKQSKETVNKQISRSGALAPKTSARTSTPNATGATKARTPTARSIGNASTTSPTKKPATLTSKTASRTSSTATKRISSSETKVLQNGIPKEDVTKAPVITATSKPEDDVPRKDTSPVNVPTDNQLIAD
ncbi:uncharacterized protein LOC105201938 isoform X2 [Solenopsis invicta]|uniref:uncharacterized protein LOC105201938 isoform X2 n=1 Tax=Solenopsis invicta TaxID=13686 RepID=UPI00193DB521|nr:uncharacterized protein LOC105201938 isoform X2 [Solenopsis invicta]